MNDTTTDQGMQSSGLTLLNLAMPVIDVRRAYEGLAIFIIESATTDGEPFALSAEDYPVLARIWDNDEDAIFDKL